MEFYLPSYSQLWLNVRRQVFAQEVTFPQWLKRAKNPDVSTAPFVCPFGRSLARLTHSLSPHCSHCSHRTAAFTARTAHSLTLKFVEKCDE